MADCTNRNRMGLDFGLDSPDLCLPTKNRWLFMIDGVSAVANALPPLSSARPSFEFKEQMVPHLTEEIYFPVRPDWKPIPLTLYDIKSNKNPVFDWIKKVYDPKEGKWTPPAQSNGGDWFKKDCALCLYDGCGNVRETWKFENTYPQNVNFGELNMSSVEVVTVEISLRFDRAYVI